MNPSRYPDLPLTIPVHLIITGALAQLDEKDGLDRDEAYLLAAERDQAEASARGYKGAATRARNRAKAGVCPCCNRTFKQLARHMKSQHPDFDPAAI